jgi:hypothetical protein
MIQQANSALEGAPNIFAYAAQHPEQVAGNAIFPGAGEMLRGGTELQTEGERARGAVRVAGGAADVLMPSATQAFFEAPVHLALGPASGAVAQQVGPVRHLVAAAGGDEATQRAASEVDFWLPTVLGSLIGLRAGSKERPVYDADGQLLGTVKVRAAAAADGRVGAVVESTPTEEIGSGRPFGELTPGDQGRVLQRAQEIKFATSKPVKGDQVVLPDGREGTVKFSHPLLPVHRVHLADGGNVAFTSC